MNEPMNQAVAIRGDPNLQVLASPPQPGGVIRLADKLDAVVESFKEYTKACEALLTKDDYQGIGNRSFKKKSAWRKIATAFNVSTRIVSSKVDYDEDGRIHHAEFVVEACAPNGRTSQAWAGASTVDRDYAHDQDVAATAQTRATNRAIADLIGCGEVSAEEMLAEKQEQRGRQASQPAQPARQTPPQSRQDAPGTAASPEITTYPVCTVKAVRTVHSKAGTPKPWTAFFLTINDGFQDMEAATFSKSIADLATELSQTGEQAKLTTKPGRKPNSREIVSLERTDSPPTQAAAEDDVPMEFDEKGQPVQEVTP